MQVILSLLALALLPCGTTAQYVELFLRQNGLKRQAPVKTPARPAQACKPGQHFPELDRQPEAGAVIYAMDNTKKPLGRPPLPEGRNVVVRLQPQHIAKAKELGNGKISAGVRAALTSGSNARSA